MKEMYAHTLAWSTQRDYIQEKETEAKADYGNKILLPYCHEMLVGDYAQTMDIPHFGGEQPSLTYYYSPVNFNVFGCVDYSTEHMETFLYHEGEGKKGGNSVVSLIHQSLKNKGLFEDAKEKGPGEYLTLVFDKCGGQNKNRIVLWYLLYLVESRIYKTVESFFLVCGHTQNICDRLFKQLKRDFHHKNVYTMGQLMNVCNISDTVTPVLCTSKDFFNWDKHLDRLYKSPGSGTVQLNHIFMATYIKPGCITTEAVKGVDSKLLMKLKKNATGGQKAARTRIIKYNKMKNEKRPGLRNVKQVDLYQKWG